MKSLSATPNICFFEGGFWLYISYPLLIEESLKYSGMENTTKSESPFEWIASAI